MEELYMAVTHFFTRKAGIFFLCLIIFILGFLSDHLVSKYFFSAPNPSPVRQKGFTYISPLLYCRYPNADNARLISKLQSNLQGYITDVTTKKEAQRISLYFHDPTTGEQTSINGSEEYALASLIKVPVMMMIYKQAETNPSFLSSTIQYSGTDANNMENFKSTGQEEMQQGHIYTVDELVSRMIIYSDNSAMNVLATHMTLKVFNDDLEQLNFNPIEGNPNTDIMMPAGKFATFFRILYNATYLNPAMSEKALKVLTKTTFTSGIVAGVPKNIAVAHKFGERAYDSEDTKQLHDCGIIYYPNHPYLLCVMTEGKDFTNLETVIQTISQKTYDIIHEEYP